MEEVDVAVEAAADDAEEDDVGAEVVVDEAAAVAVEVAVGVAIQFRLPAKRSLEILVPLGYKLKQK